ncbi:MAG: signal peptidase II [Desulfovibrio sp.]|uniref:signal peptidase II n=1 Tax=Desulfovibrio sp. 7SRBS1 TaxID=3378064 RepID=UPI003B3C5B3C
MPKRYVYVPTSALLIILLDQASKLWILAKFPLWQVKPVIPGFFNLVHVANRGAAFGFLNNSDTNWQLYLFMGFTLLALSVVAYLVRTTPPNDRLQLTALACITGGALGNFIDRVRLDYVVDFLDFYVGKVHWPAFNVADICICAGAGLLFLAFLRNEKNKAKGTEK